VSRSYAVPPGKKRQAAPMASGTLDAQNMRGVWLKNIEADILIF
jgi:hypothetical protein